VGVSDIRQPVTLNKTIEARSPLPIGAIAHRRCRLIWKLLHDGVTYEERGPAVTTQRAQRRAAQMVRELRRLGYHVERVTAPASGPACRARGYRAMQFNFVVSTNERAVRLWESLGFTIVGRLPLAFRHPTHGYVDALVMFQSL
jgi:hypothetical protein